LKSKQQVVRINKSHQIIAVQEQFKQLSNICSAIEKVDTNDFTEKTLVAFLRNGYTHDVSFSVVHVLTKKKDKNNAEALIIKMETGRAYHGIKTNFYKEGVGAHGTMSAITLEVCAAL
jgi:3-methyladenine DNA glycosylase AlkC